MEENGMEAYVKYNRFHIEHRMHYAPNPFSADAMHYNADEDYYVCPMGQKMERTGTRRGKTQADTSLNKPDTGRRTVPDVRCMANVSRLRETG